MKILFLFLILLTICPTMAPKARKAKRRNAKAQKKEAKNAQFVIKRRIANSVKRSTQAKNCQKAKVRLEAIERYVDQVNTRLL